MVKRALDIGTGVGKYEAAAAFYLHSLKIREKILGWEGPLLLKTRQVYAAMLQKMEKETAYIL